MVRSGDNLAVRWLPETAEERQALLLELDALLASYHFRSSKRYPALLRYIVDETLQGRAQELKERTLGVAVFDRRPDYDTNADPVVRYSAGEIRKRIAQYYYEKGDDAELQINLPLGSYIPEFKLAARRAAAPPPISPPEAHPREEPALLAALSIPALPPSAPAAPPPTLSQPAPAPSLSWPATLLWRRSLFALVAAVLVLLAFDTYSARVASKARTADGLWAPLLKSPTPVLIVVGSGHPQGVTPDPARTSLHDQMEGPFHNISISSAVALSRVAVVLEQNGRANLIKESSATSLADVRSRSIILLGGLNNSWTLRLLQPLRFHFDWNVIRDAANPAQTDWTLDFARPVASVSSDYAIVARYFDPTTKGNVLIIAGIGPYGTEAASEFVSSGHDLQQFASTAGPGWESKNFEIVLKTVVINGEAGPPSVVAATMW